MLSPILEFVGLAEDARIGFELFEIGCICKGILSNKYSILLLRIYIYSPIPFIFYMAIAATATNAIVFQII